MSSSTTPVAATNRRQPGWANQLSAWLPVLLAVSCIAVESQPYFGADHTTGPLRRIVEWIAGPLPQDVWEHWHLLIRKTGHFVGYGLVSVTWFRAIWMTFRTDLSWNARRVSIHALAMAGTFLVASADEFHQTFLPNRTGRPLDVVIDCCGGLLAQIIIFLVMLRFNREQHVRFSQ